MFSIEVFNRVAVDDNIRQRICITAEHFYREIGDIEIGPCSEILIRIGSDADGELLHAAIFVISLDVINADMREAVNCSLLERQ